MVQNDSIMEREPGVDILCLDCKHVGVLSGDKTTTVVVDLSEAMDDEYEE